MVGLPLEERPLLISVASLSGKYEEFKPTTTTTTLHCNSNQLWHALCRVIPTILIWCSEVACFVNHATKTAGSIDWWIDLFVGWLADKIDSTIQRLIDVYDFGIDVGSTNIDETSDMSARVPVFLALFDQDNFHLKDYECGNLGKSTVWCCLPAFWSYRAVNLGNFSNKHQSVGIQILLQFSRAAVKKMRP